MCGISALFLTRPGEQHASFSRSLDLIRHRGPDGRGVVWGQGLDGFRRGERFTERFSWALGHVRLAILDTSSRGLQPMSYREDGYWITYNGEVYNYLELRGELEGLGHVFRTGTDTEVILASYAQWGEDCVTRFIGMFAFVLVDRINGRVLSARDRLGIKPLYIWQQDSMTFLFSEPKQLLAFPGFSFRVNRQQLADLLIDDVVNHTADESLFEGVTPLAPGHVLSWALDGTPPDPAGRRRYWSLPEETRICTRLQATEQVREMLLDSVKLRLRSDVPVGSCLSGGMDSSSLVGIAARDFGAAMNTFSSCFEGYAFDEQRYMDAVNQHCGTTPCKVFPDGDRFADELEQVIYHQDEPFGGTSIYSQWCIMRAARQKGVPVLLDGQGADEALCGYKKFALLYLRTLFHRRRYGRALGHAALTLVNGDRQLWDLRQGERYLPRVLRRRTAGIRDLLRPAWRDLTREVWSSNTRGDMTLKDFQRGDLLRWSLPALLRYEDRNSMAHSIESRVPFVDHRFVELCFQLPDDLFFARGRAKRLLAGAMGDRIPDCVRRRRDKYGFNTPSSDWMQGRLGDVLRRELDGSSRLAEIMDTDNLSSPATRSRIPTAKLFSIACVAAWMRIFKVDL